MHTEAKTAQIIDGAADRTHGRRAARLGIGLTVTFLLAMAFDYTLAYLAPVFVAPLLQARDAPSLASTTRIIVMTFIIMTVCYLAGGVARIYPLLFLVGLVIGLFYTFRYGLRGGSTLTEVLLLIGFMLVPMAAKVSQEISRDLITSFVQNISLVLAVAHVMFAIIPPAANEPAPAPKPTLTPTEVDTRAWRMTIITGSFAIVYYSFDWTNVHTPLYIAIFVQQLSLTRGLVLTKAILAANIAGGIIAMVLYNLIAMAPNFLFMAAISLTVILIFARAMTSQTRTAPLAAAALSVMFIILGGAMGPLEEYASYDVFDRLGEIGAAALYAVAALYVLEAFFPAENNLVPAQQ